MVKISKKETCHKMAYHEVSYNNDVYIVKIWAKADIFIQKSLFNNLYTVTLTDENENIIAWIHDVEFLQGYSDADLNRITKNLFEEVKN